MTEKQALAEMEKVYGTETPMSAMIYPTRQDWSATGQGAGRYAVRRPDRISITRWFAGESFEEAIALAASSLMEDQQLGLNTEPLGDIANHDD